MPLARFSYVICFQIFAISKETHNNAEIKFLYHVWANKPIVFKYNNVLTNYYNVINILKLLMETCVSEKACLPFINISHIHELCEVVHTFYRLWAHGGV